MSHRDWSNHTDLRLRKGWPCGTGVAVVCLLRISLPQLETGRRRDDIFPARQRIFLGLEASEQLSEDGKAQLDRKQARTIEPDQAHSRPSRRALTRFSRSNSISTAWFASHQTRLTSSASPRRRSAKTTRRCAAILLRSQITALRPKGIMADSPASTMWPGDRIDMCTSTARRFKAACGPAPPRFFSTCARAGAWAIGFCFPLPGLEEKDANLVAIYPRQLTATVRQPGG
jgi:hypothetical protein